MRRLWVASVALTFGLALATIATTGPSATASSAAAHAWSPVHAGQPAPSPRMDHTAIYDAAAGRLIVFGGVDDSGRLAETWALSLTESPSWTKLEPAGDAPVARSAHTAVYDPVGRRMIVFGGGNVAGRLGDVWALALDGAPAWAQLSPTTGAAPAPRAGHVAVYDSQHHRMLVFGGWDGQYYRDTWALALNGAPAWSRITATENGLWDQSDHAAAYDPIGQRLVAFAGWRSTSRMPSLSQTTWALTLAGAPAWAQLDPAGAAPAFRINHSAVYDPNGRRLLVFGGGNPLEYRTYGDLWALSLDGAPAWSLVDGGSSGPTARTGQAATWDAKRGRLLVFGGSDGQRNLNDVWAFGAAGVTPVEPTAPLTPTVAVTATATTSPTAGTGSPTVTPTAAVTTPLADPTPRAGQPRTFLPATFAAVGG